MPNLLGLQQKKDSMQKYAQLVLLTFGLLLNVYIQAASTNTSIAGLSVETISKLDESEIAWNIIYNLEAKKFLSSPFEIVHCIDDALKIKAQHASFLSSCINQFKNMLAPEKTAKKPLARPTLQELPEYLQTKTKQRFRKKRDLYPIQCILNYFYCTRMQTYKDLTKAEELYLRQKSKNVDEGEVNEYLIKIIYENYPNANPYIVASHIDDFYECIKKTGKIAQFQNKEFKTQLMPEWLVENLKQVKSRSVLEYSEKLLKQLYCAQIANSDSKTLGEKIYCSISSSTGDHHYLAKDFVEALKLKEPIEKKVQEIQKVFVDIEKGNMKTKGPLSLKKQVATMCAKNNIDTSYLRTLLLLNACLERPHIHRRFLSKSLQASCKKKPYDSRVKDLYGYIYRNNKLDDENLAKMIIDLHEETYSDMSPFEIARTIDQALGEQGYEPVATFNLAHIPHYLQKIITKPSSSDEKKLAKQLSFLQMKTCALSKGEELCAKMHLPIYYHQNEEEVVDSAIQDLASLVKEVVAKANPSAHPYIITSYIQTLLENIKMVPKKSSCTQNKELRLEHKPKWLKPPKHPDDKKDYAEFLHRLYCAQILSNSPTKAETLFCKACLHISTVENEPKDFFWPHLKLKHYCWLFKDNKNKVSIEEVQKIFETIKNGKKQTPGPLSLKKQIACVVAKHNVNISKMQKLLFYGTYLEKI